MAYELKITVSAEKDLDTIIAHTTYKSIQVYISFDYIASQTSLGIFAANGIFAGYGTFP